MRSNDLAVAGGPDLDRLFDEAGEAMADALGGAAVEAEHVLVEIGLEMRGADGTVVGP